MGHSLRGDNVGSKCLEPTLHCLRVPDMDSLPAIHKPFLQGPQRAEQLIPDPSEGKVLSHTGRLRPPHHAARQAQRRDAEHGH